MERAVVTHGDYQVVLEEATYLMGVRRTILVSQGLSAGAKRDEDEDAPGTGFERDLATYLVQVYAYPACIASTITNKGFEEWPIPFEKFLELPEVFVSEWERKAYELNPHWMPELPSATEEEEEAKKVPGELDKKPSPNAS